MYNKKFIITMDNSTAKQLYAAGFKLLSQNGNKHVFLNMSNDNFNFEQFDKTKIVYTDLLTF